MARAGGIWLTRRKSMPTKVRASRCLCRLRIVLKNVRGRHRGPNQPSLRLPYSPTAALSARRKPFTNAVAESCEALSRRFSGILAFGLKGGRSAAGRGS